jgi:hypothetical protein
VGCCVCLTTALCFAKATEAFKYLTGRTREREREREIPKRSLGTNQSLVVYDGLSIYILSIYVVNTTSFESLMVKTCNIS